jgi:hypothetical protein
MNPAIVLCLCLVASAKALGLFDQLHSQFKGNDQTDQLDSEPLAEIKYPVLLVPGISASQIDARLNKTTSVSPFCSKKSDWYTIWLNPALLIPGAIDCWIDNFKLTYNEKTGRTENTPGVETRVPGFGDVRTIEYLSSIHLPQSEFYYLFCN